MLARPVFQFLNPFVWRSEKSIAKKLFGFAQTERGSALTLRQAAALTMSPARQAMYLRHAADEDRHARLFSARSRALHARAHAPVRADAEDLFQMLGEIQFLAFVHHAEWRGRRQFEIYQPWFLKRGDTKTSQMLAEIIDDERHHERYSYQLLLELCGSTETANRALAKVRRWEAWRQWRRLGQGTAGSLYSLLIWAICPLLLPYSWFLRLIQPNSAGWKAPLPLKD